MRAKSVLLAEDSALDAELTLKALQPYRLTNKVDVVRDGTEALDYLYCRGPFADREPGNPVLILLDLKMPKVDGLEVLRQIRTDPTLRLVPVVVLTSSREQQDIVDSYQLGVNAYIVKPVEYEKFIEAVRQLGLFWLLMNEPPLD
ncbi:MAG: response regulator [Betaproteobacteria bacterium]|nr:response regulator [Betaproteobacteria bacterium]